MLSEIETSKQLECFIEDLLSFVNHDISLGDKAEEMISSVLHILYSSAHFPVMSKRSTGQRNISEAKISEQYLMLALIMRYLWPHSNITVDKKKNFVPF